MRSIDAARRASDLQPCQEVIEIFDLQLGKGDAVFFEVGMESGQKAFDLSEVVERRFVGLLVEIGLKGIGQLDFSPWDSQRAGSPAVDRKKARQWDESTRCVLETAKVGKPLLGVEGEHILPGHLVVCCEAKKVDQNEGIPDKGAMGPIGLYGCFPFKVIHDGIH